MGTQRTETYHEPVEANEYSDCVGRNSTYGFGIETSRPEATPTNLRTTLEPGEVLAGAGEGVGERYWTLPIMVQAAKAWNGKSPSKRRAIAVIVAKNFFIRKYRDRLFVSGTS